MGATGLVVATGVVGAPGAIGAAGVMGAAGSAARHMVFFGITCPLTSESRTGGD